MFNIVPSTFSEHCVRGNRSANLQCVSGFSYWRFVSVSALYRLQGAGPDLLPMAIWPARRFVFHGPYSTQLPSQCAVYIYFLDPWFKFAAGRVVRFQPPLLPVSFLWFSSPFQQHREPLFFTPHDGSCACFYPPQINSVLVGCLFSPLWFSIGHLSGFSSHSFVSTAVNS